MYLLYVLVPTQVFAAGTVNIYSHRQQVLINPFWMPLPRPLASKPKRLCIERLAQRLRQGAAARRCILTVDIARLAEYAALDLLAPIDSAVLTANIPAHLRAWTIAGLDCLNVPDSGDIERPGAS